jgi:hypothetical protein
VSTVPASAPVVVPLASRRRERAERMQALLDGISGVTLALQARERLGRGGPAAALGWAEIAVAVLLVATAVALVRGRHHLGRWVSALAGVVLLCEGIAKTWGPKGHPSWALTLNGLVLLAMTALAPVLEARRARLWALRLDGAGLSYRRGLFRRFAVRREQIARVEINARAAHVRLRNGRGLRLDLADLHNHDELEAALRKWAAAVDIEIADGAVAAPATAPALPAART